MNKAVSKRITIFGFLMTCIIVLYHSGTSVDPMNVFDSKWNDFVNSSIEFLGILAMSHFFAVSGYLLFRGMSYEKYPEKIKKRFVSLIIPYLLWQIIVTIKLLIQGNNISIVEFINSVFLLQRWPPNSALWYLYAIFILALLSPVFLFFFSNKKIGSWILLILVIGVFRLKFVSNPTILLFYKYGYIENILRYFPAYILGSFYGLHSTDAIFLDDLKYIVAFIFISFLFDGLYPGFLYTIVISCLPIMFIYIVPISDKISDLSIYSLSFLIYALHQSIIGDIISYVQLFMTNITSYAFIINISTRIICLLIVLVIVKVIHYFMNKYVPNILKYLCGGRAN